MTVSDSVLKRTLRSVFDADFSCVPLTAGRSYGFVVSPCALDKSTGFSVKVKCPYPDSCKASVSFGAFSRSLLERWFRQSENVEKAFDFVASLSDKIKIDIQVAGKRVLSAEEFAIEHSSNWASAGVAVRFAIRGYGKEETDSQVVLITIAALGFTLIASGFVVEEDDQGEIEGRAVSSTTTRYERSRANRARCLSHYGTKCFVCGFDFGETFGDFANGFIEVHHITPVSQMNEPMEVDPIRDLVPLCPNCHAAVHLADPPIHPNILKSLIESNRSNQ